MHDANLTGSKIAAFQNNASNSDDSKKSERERRTVVIAGASGGIGRALVESYRGENVALYLQANRNAAKLRDWARQSSADFAQLNVFEANLATEAGAQTFCDDVFNALKTAQHSNFPRIDAFVDAAGVDLMEPSSKARSFEERLALIWTIDVAAAIRLSRFFGAAIRASLAEKRRALQFQRNESINEPNLYQLNFKDKTTCNKENQESIKELKINQNKINRVNNQEICDTNNQKAPAPCQESETFPFRSAAFVLFGWDGTERGMKGETAQLYAAAKGAVAGFAKSLAQELAPDVRVNVVSPGWIRTTWGAVASASASARVASESLSGRWGTSGEVAALVRFLLSDEASYLNAQNIELNGGFSH